MLSGLAELTHYNERARAHNHEVANKNGLSLKSAPAFLSPWVYNGLVFESTNEALLSDAGRLMECSRCCRPQFTFSLPVHLSLTCDRPRNC